MSYTMSGCYVLSERKKSSGFDKKLIFEILLAICIISIYLMIYVLATNDVRQELTNFVELVSGIFK